MRGSTPCLFPAADISPVGPAIHGDFYSITGTDFADFVFLIFEKGSIEVAVLPDVRRRHWLMVERLPPNVPTGRCMVSVWAPESSRRSARVPVDVSAGAPLTVRTLYPGRPAPDPYTIVMAATPAHVTQVTGPAGEVIPSFLEADPVLTNRAGFMTLVRKGLDGLLKFDGAVLDIGPLAASVRFVSIFDPTQAVTAANALVVTREPNIIEPNVGSVLKTFTGRYAQRADIVFCVTSMSTHTRASARWTTDDLSRAQVEYTYDDVVRKFGRYASVPGGVALSTFDDSSLTALHEVLSCGWRLRHRHDLGPLRRRDSGRGVRREQEGAGPGDRCDSRHLLHVQRAGALDPHRQRHLRLGSGP